MPVKSFSNSCQEVNDLLIEFMPSMIEDWLPDGRIEGNAYVALNPRRDDENLGSFRIEFSGAYAGRWRDWAMQGIGGTDFISLFAYIRGLRQGQALAQLRKILRRARLNGGRP